MKSGGKALDPSKQWRLHCQRRGDQRFSAPAGGGLKAILKYTDKSIRYPATAGLHFDAKSSTIGRCRELARAAQVGAGFENLVFDRSHIQPRRRLEIAGQPPRKKTICRTQKRFLTRVRARSARAGGSAERPYGRRPPPQAKK
jgi:hypothetical protein